MSHPPGSLSQSSPVLFLSLMGLNIKVQSEQPTWIQSTWPESWGALYMVWRPSPAALMKDLFCLWIGPFFCPERKKGALSPHFTIDNYRIVLSCYFLRHKRPIGVFILAEDRLPSLWSPARRIACVSSAKIGLCRHPAPSEFSHHISWKRKSLIHLTQPNVPFPRRHSFKTHGPPPRTCPHSKVPHLLVEAPRLQGRTKKL